MASTMNARIVKIKIGLRDIFESIFKPLPTFSEQEAKRQISLVNQQRYSLTSEGNCYFVRKDHLLARLRKDSSDLSVFEQVFIAEEYKALVQVALLNGIAVRNVIDLGSNIGLASLYLSKHFPSASFICVEPDLGNFEILKMNTASLPILRLYQNAVWSGIGKLGLNTGFRDGQGWSISVSPDLEASFSSIDSITVNQIMEENNLNEIDVLKIDIEGSEFEIFKENGTTDFLEKVKLLAIEIHDDAGPREKIISILRNHGFLLFEFSETVIGVNKRHVLTFE